MSDSPVSIVFDLDGTLVDTAPDLLASLNAVLAKAGHRPVVPSELRHLVGYGVRRLFERAFAETGTNVSDDKLEHYSDQFLDYYRAHIADGSTAFPHVAETLDRLAADGALMGVCTNKPHDLTLSLLDRLGLARHFTVVIGAGLAPYNKPDARHVLDVITALGGQPERAVMVGNSPIDVAAARNANIPVIVMTYGYTPVPVADIGADALTGNFSDVPSLVAKLLR